MKPYTKNARIRYVPISKKLSLFLKDLSSEDPSEDLVLPEMSVDCFHRSLARLALRAHLPVIRFHDLRHSFASNFLTSGGRIYHLQRILGHSSIKVTERYAHLDPSQLQGSTDKLYGDVEDADTSSVP